MTISETATTTVPARRVWDILDEPVLMEQWNPKCRKCHTDASSMSKGLSFSVEFAMKNRVRTALCTVVARSVPTKLVLRYDYEHGQKGRVTETFEIIGKNDHTKIRHTIDLGESGIPGWAQVIMKLLTTFGRKMGPGSVDGIKALAEES